jgi:hypothetical protein
LHDHDGRYFQESEFSSDTGTNSKPLETDSSGILTTSILISDNDMKAGGGIVSGSSSINVPTGTINLKEVSAPGTPPSGYGVLYVTTTGFIHFKNDAGTDWTLSDVA